MGDNAAGIPSLLSGLRKTYKPKHRPVPGNLDSSSSAIHRRAPIHRGPPYRRAMLCLVGRVTACPERSRMGERRFLVDRHWRVATAIAFDRY